MWRIRWALVIHKRLRLILFVVLIWAAILLMQQITWNSRSYLLEIIGNLSFAWLIVALTTRLIGNPLLRSSLRYFLWGWITLRILGLTDEFAALMDSLAFHIGEVRFSLLILLQALLVIGALWVIARFVSRTATGRIQGNADISPSMQVLAVKALQIASYSLAVFIGLKVDPCSAPRGSLVSRAP